MKRSPVPPPRPLIRSRVTITAAPALHQHVFRNLVIGGQHKTLVQKRTHGCEPAGRWARQIVMNARTRWHALLLIRYVIHRAMNRSWRIAELAHLDETELRLSESCGKRRRRAIEARALDDVVASQNFIDVAEWPGSDLEFAVACAHDWEWSLSPAGRWRDSRARIRIRPRDPQRKCRQVSCPLGSPHVCRHRAR